MQLRLMYISDELKLRVEELKKELNISGDMHRLQTEIFMSAPNQLKEAYVQSITGYDYYGLKLIHVLLLNHPRFLEFNARWVDVLFDI